MRIACEKVDVLLFSATFEWLSKEAPPSGGLLADSEDVLADGVPAVEEMGDTESDMGGKGQTAHLENALAVCDTVVVKIGQLSWAAHGANSIRKMPYETASNDVRQIMAIICLIIEGFDSLCRDIEGAFHMIG